MQKSDFRFDIREASGAVGDLGTLLPLMLGAIVVAGLAPGPVLAGFGLAYCATALLYRLPVPVQPMKAIAAVLLVTEVPPATLAASGAMIGAVLLVLGLTGWSDRLGRLVPQAILAGLQLGLGLALALLAFGFMAGAPGLGAAAVALLGLLLLFPRLPAALILVALAALLGAATGDPSAPPAVAAARPAMPHWPDLKAAAALALPQLSLTLTNAVVLTALVAGDLYGARARHVTPRRLSISTGLINLTLAPLGALPMCHGAGGLAAHHRFGARSGGAPLILGTALLGLALLPGETALALLRSISPAVLGALLLFAAAQLAWSRRLVDCKPSCRPVIAVTAVAALLWGPFWALIAGTLAELLRLLILRHLARRSRP